MEMEQLNSWIGVYLARLHMPTIHWNDVAEIAILTFVAYHILVWIKNTRAWALLKGVIVIMVFIVIAAFCKMNTILWIVPNIISIAATAFVVVLQPELRADRTVNEIVKASFEMGKVKTGALIVIEHEQSLKEYERTGIDVDGIISSQLLINIFEHNTPLHDGAVIVRGNRIVSATCYLPLSDNMALSKDLGTRHRAGVGISEVTDSLTVIVSEETGKISVAYGGALERGLDAARLKERLLEIQDKPIEEKKRKLFKGKSIGKAGVKNEE